MKTSPSGVAPMHAFWTWRKKLFLLLLVIFVTFSYYYLSLGGITLESWARENLSFSYYYLINRIWYTNGRTDILMSYLFCISPFLLAYIFWWRKPNISRSLFPCSYMFLLAIVATCYLRSCAMAVTWPHAVSVNPDYITQIPAWLRFLYL